MPSASWQALKRVSLHWAIADAGGRSIIVEYIQALENVV